MVRGQSVALCALAALALAACEPGDRKLGPVEPLSDGSVLSNDRPGRTWLVERGRELFFDETFGGNGRTCGTCHPAPTMVLTPADIARLPADDPFFAGILDIEPEAARRGLIRYPLGGTSLLDPEIVVFRGIPSIQSLRRTGPFTADGRARTLQEQAAEAVLLHLLDGAVDRPGERMPTSEELDAIAAFQESVRPTDTGPVEPGTGRRIALGRALFMGKAACAVCHAPPDFTDNAFHDIVARPPQDPVNDPGRCRIDPAAPDCGSGSSFNTPQLRGLSQSAPFFHDNRHPTLRAVVDFYDSPAFSRSPAAGRLGIGPLELSEAERDALVAFLESL